MSRSEWEAGTIKLPTAEAPKVRDAVKKASDAHRQKLYDTAQEFWKQLPAAHKRDKEKYRTACTAFIDGNNDQRFDPATKSFKNVPLDPKLPLTWRGIGDGDEDGGFGWDLSNLLSSVTHSTQKVTREHSGGSFTTNVTVETEAHRVKWPDVDRVSPKATGASFAISVGEGHLAFKGRVLHWEVGENNHARDRGRSHPIAQALFAALDRVTWTRGSGGEIVGNDEYSQDDRSAGGGANYVIDRYGPTINRRPAPPRYSYAGRW